MIANIHNIARALYPKRPSWEVLWHPWMVVIPRRSITGRLVWGTVWRRRNGRRWIYKQHIWRATSGTSRRDPFQGAPQHQMRRIKYR
jgi:hypothetical protein